ncbi:hypothetical protein SASC256_05710 [Staphylococcus argenteus]|nr:hypothetical protein SA19088_00640 [Staphylococcus argenteus]GJF92483.1 hypothetical protein SASC210_05670 [Staphylococcus argenteus]GJF95110.1 hypothetical protein SASC252_05690 [Staphylococcus argenteus]GJF97266.1 hypothetical protein SASC253_00640 [Staphylococcus argenteus]GJF99901.1 hypothetical protein SASC254_00640 [Staphylococcus argenteus]
MGYKNILIDFDDTIVDFYDAEEWAFHYMANLFDHKATDLDFLEFKKLIINIGKLFNKIN